MGRHESAAAGPGSRALVVDVIRSSGPISRVELVEATGLTQPTISNIVRRLILDGVVRETGDTVATGGKPRALLVINSHALYAIGIHLAPDAITCVATDARGGTIGRELVAGAGDDEPQEVVDRLGTLCRDVMDGLGLTSDAVAGIGVVAPGPVDVDRGELLGPPGLARWAGTKVRDHLRDALDLPVLLDNDAAAAAIGEFWSRQISRERTFGCLYFGSGIGSGVVLDGALQRGASSNAGEIGHVTVERNGVECPCGNRGCLERYAAPDVVVAAARADARLSERLGIVAADSDSRAFDVLTRAAIYGDAESRALVDESVDHLADGAVTMVNLWDLDTLVLAGPGFAVAGSIYADEIRRRLSARAFARLAHGVDVRLSSNPRDSAAIGAAALVLQGSVAPGHGPQVGLPTPAGHGARG